MPMRRRRSWLLFFSALASAQHDVSDDPRAGFTPEQRLADHLRLRRRMDAKHREFVDVRYSAPPPQPLSSSL
jgi:hypothetical protein